MFNNKQYKKAVSIVLRPGFWDWLYKGQKKPGLDLGRFVRDVMRSCGYPCLTCTEPNCVEKDILNPDIRTKIEDLQAQINDLKSELEALA